MLDLQKLTNELLKSGDSMYITINGVELHIANVGTKTAVFNQDETSIKIEATEEDTNTAEVYDFEQYDYEDYEMGGYTPLTYNEGDE